MLRIEIWLVPHGIENRKEKIHEIEIYNDATSQNKSIGNYVAKLSQRGCNRLWKTTEIKDFPRLKLNSFDLLYRVLRKIVGKRNEGS